MAQESSHGLAGCLWLRVSQATVRMSAGAAVISRLGWGKICQMMQLLEDLDDPLLNSLIWPLAGLRSWLAFDQRHQVLATWTFSCGLLTAGPLASPKQGLWEEKSKTKVTVFLEPNLRSSTNYFSYILSIRSKSLGPAHNQGRRLHKDINIKRQGSLGTTLKAAYYSIP